MENKKKTSVWLIVLGGVLAAYGGYLLNGIWEPVSYTHLDVYKRQGDTEVDLAKETYGRLATLYGRKTEAQFLRNAEMGELPETARKKISEILAVLKKYENKDKKPLSGHSR